MVSISRNHPSAEGWCLLVFDVLWHIDTYILLQAFSNYKLNHNTVWWLMMNLGDKSEFCSCNMVPCRSTKLSGPALHEAQPSLSFCANTLSPPTHAITNSILAKQTIYTLQGCLWHFKLSNCSGTFKHLLVSFTLKWSPLALINHTPLISRPISFPSVTKTLPRLLKETFHTRLAFNFPLPEKEFSDKLKKPENSFLLELVAA